MSQINIEYEVENLKRHCREQGLDFMCYVGSSDKNEGILSIDITGEESLANGIAKCSKNSLSVYELFRKIYVRLKGVCIVKSTA